MNAEMQVGAPKAACTGDQAVCAFPSTSAQQRLWYLDQLDPGNAVYNISWAIRIRGSLDVEALGHSLNEIVRRHEILRTTFSMREGDIVQVVAPVLTISLPVTDLEAEPERERRAREAASLEGERAFDLATGPLLRARLMRLGEQEHVLVLALHHIIFDGWSRGILVREFAAAYEAFAGGRQLLLPRPPLQFADYAVWQQKHLQGKRVQRALEFWRRELEGMPAGLNLPVDRPRPAAPSFRGASHAIAVPATVAEQLGALGRSEGATMFMVVLAALEVVLARYSGQNDLTIGTLVANRNRTEVEGLIGLFANTLVLRARLSDELSFRDLLKRVREGAVAAFAHQDLPFDRLVQDLRPQRAANQNPLFQTLFSLQSAPREEFQLPGLELSTLEDDAATAKFDLAVFVTDTPHGLRGRFEYSTDLFDATTIGRMAESFQVVLQAIVADPSAPISRLPLLSANDRKKVLLDFNATRTEYLPDVCVHDLVEEQARQTPDAVAVIHGMQQVTYGALNARANRLARFLRRRSVGPDVLVAICASRSTDMLIGILGILKAGGAYVPLDPAYPKQRLATILEDSRSRILLTQRALIGELPQFAGEIVCMEELAAELEAESHDDLDRLVTPGNLAYVLFTSGSTGRPKGVAIEHHSSATFVQWGRSIHSPAELSGVLFSTSLCFDLCIFEIFVTLSSGGKLIIAENALELATLPARDQVTLINTVPTAALELTRMRAIPDSVTVVNLCGEALPPSLVGQVYSAARVEKLFNFYGPTEDTTYSTYALMRQGQPVTIGRPMANSQAYILDSGRNPTPIGVPGELYLAGDGLARGYYGRDDLTAERFVPNPFGSAGARMYRTGDLCRWLPNGEIDFLGRIDHQVKLRGYRIELGEIESGLVQHPAVSQSVVVLREDRPGDKNLVAYVVLQRGASESPSELREGLRRKLPDYMVPTFFVMLESLPLTPNGKIDRKALPAPDYSPSGFSQGTAGQTKIAPRDDFEVIVAGVWRRILAREDLGVTEDFFELGGHSLMAARMIHELSSICGITLPLAELMRGATIEHLASVLRGDTAPRTHSTLMEIQVDGSAPPFFAVVTPGANSLGYVALSRALGNGQPFYKLQGGGEQLLHRPYTDVENEQLAAEYVRVMRAVQTEGPYYIGGMCEGARIAFDMARILESQGQRLALLAMFDTWAVENSQIRWRWYIHAYGQRLRRLWTLRGSEKWGAVKHIVDRRTGRVRESNVFDKEAWHAYYWPPGFAPKPIKATITAFKIQKQPHFYVQDPLMGWGSRTTGGVDVRHIESRHLQLLREPWVRNLAQALGERLRRSKAQVT